MLRVIISFFLCVTICYGQNNDIAIPDIPASVVLNQDVSTFLRNSSLRKIAVSVGQNAISGDHLSPFGFEYSFNKNLSASVGSSINSNRKIAFGVKWTIIDDAEVIKNQKFSELKTLITRLNDKTSTYVDAVTQLIADKYSVDLTTASTKYKDEIEDIANHNFQLSHDSLLKIINPVTRNLSWAKTNLSFAAAMSVGSTNEQWKNLNIDSSYRIQVWTTYSRQIESWFQVQGGATFLTQKTFNTDSTSGGLNLTSFLGSNETKGSLQLSGRWGNHSLIGKIDINGEFNIGENQWIVLGVKWESVNHVWTPVIDFKTGLSNN